jgi:hypothetical protein
MSSRPDTEPVDDQPTAVLPAVDPPLTAEQIVAKPAVEGDLEKEMRAVAQPFTKLTIALGVIVVVALAFGAGAWTHAALGGASTSSATATGGAGGRAGGAGGRAGGTGTGTGTGGAPGGTGGRGGAAGRGTIGTVDRIDGTTVYIKTFQGTDVAVSTTDSTRVATSQPGQLSDLKAGTSVTVTGATGSDGSVTAQSITVQPARSGG